MDDKNPTTNNGVTPLYLAAENGHLEICKLIIENLDDKSPPIDERFIPLCIAAHNGHLKICQLLMNMTRKQIFTNAGVRNRLKAWNKHKHWNWRIRRERYPGGIKVKNFKKK